MEHHSDIPRGHYTETGKYPVISTATVYKMEANLKKFLDNHRTQVPREQYQHMYARLINLSTKGLKQVYASLESGNTEQVFSFLKRKQPNG